MGFGVKLLYTCAEEEVVKYRSEAAPGLGNPKHELTVQ